MNRNEIILNKIIIPFVKAWNLFFEISIPLTLKPLNNNKNVSDKNSSAVLYFIPIIGLVLGLSAYILSWFVSAIGGAVLASILCPFIIVLSWELLNHAKDTGSLVQYIYIKIFEHYNSDSIETHTNENNFMVFYIFAAIFMIRIACIGIFIYYHNFGWIVITAVLTYAVQGHLAAEEKNNSTDRKPIIIMWIITAVLCFLFGAEYFPIIILTFIITVFLAVRAKNSYEKTNSLSGTNIGFTGKYTEIIVLLLGLLFRFQF